MHWPSIQAVTQAGVGAYADVCWEVCGTQYMQCHGAVCHITRPLRGLGSYCLDAWTYIPSGVICVCLRKHAASSSPGHHLASRTEHDPAGSCTTV